MAETTDDSPTPSATRRTPDPTQGLGDLRVVEMGQLLAGPFAGQVFADFGAEVIKLEQPGSGDPMRVWGRERPYGQSLWWPVVARNKKSVTCNLREAEGQELARELIASADVMIENFRPGTVERWGLGYDELSKLNPGLVMVRVTGFGQTGPYSHRPGYGAIGEAMGGLRYIVGEPDRAPSRTGISIGDTLAAMFAAIGGLVALHHRTTTGRGQVVDSALYEAVLGVMESVIPEFAIGDYIRERTGAILPNVAPSNVYPTADGRLMLIAANQDTVFARLAEAMGRPEYGTDDRYATHTARGAHQGELDELISEWTATLTYDALETALEEHGVPYGQIYRAPEMLDDPHFTARDAIVRLTHPELGEFPMQNVVPKLSDTPGKVNWVGPELGEHNDEIYRGVLGLDAERMTALASSGII